MLTLQTLYRHAARPAAAWCRALPFSSSSACAAAASAGGQPGSSSGVVDQLLAYVDKDLQGQGQAAIDVLRSGLSMLPPSDTGYGAGRLHMALSEAFAAEHDWAQSAASATAASTAFTDAAANTPASPADAASLAGLAGFQACWTFLAGSRDSEAAAAANTKLPLLSLAIHGSQLLVDHATTSSSAPGPPAAVTEGQATLSRDLARQQQQQARDAQKSLLRAVCHKVAGDAALALDDAESASTSYAAAKQACDDSSSSSSGGAGVSHRLQHQVAADVLMGQAQVLMAGKQWDKAEEVLGQALTTAEAAAAASTTSSALLAPVLLLLATGYCRSARVVLAEGLLREAAKLLGGSEPHRLLEGTAGHSLAHQPCHPSLKAAVCWRYAQLLTALPNRAAEAEAWASAGRKLLAESGGQGFGAGVAIQDVLGDVAALKGQGQHGRGAIVSLMARRLLPVFG